jgi:RNA polymerase sigma factor (sigma-70 family)
VAARAWMERVLQDAWRPHAPRVLAALVRRYGDLDAAEDALQEALLAASRRWPAEGLPDDPGAWLVTVASRRLVDARRSDLARARREVLAARLDPGDTVADLRGDDADDSLELLLLCCHPALPPPAQVALTLRAVGGLTTAQIARAFLVPEATMAQRVSRAKARLRAVGARFDPPTAAELPGRLAAAAHVLYLIFTEGHTTTTGPGLYDVQLAQEAIRLARLLHERLPDVGEVAGLLALMLLTDARRAARMDADGALVPLAEQDRTRWDRARIREGISLVEAALPVGPVGPYQLQAAIAAVHAEAERAEDTDWAQIAVLYEMLARIAPGPVVTLNRAVAVAMVEGPDAGLAMVDPLLRGRRPQHDHRLHAVRAHLLELAGEGAQARQEYLLAASATTSTPEQRYLRRRATRAAPTARRRGG